MWEVISRGNANANAFDGLRRVEPNSAAASDCRRLALSPIPSGGGRADCLRPFSAAPSDCLRSLTLCDTSWSRTSGAMLTLRHCIASASVAPDFLFRIMFCIALCNN
jgi:hypothetical protein